MPSPREPRHSHTLDASTNKICDATHVREGRFGYLPLGELLLEAFADDGGAFGRD
jgi:hypothetical protein